ncbi:MAG: formylglycine-generating enzyme family protein [Candidatus Methylumidiphilus alinenensis]|uniref:Formylglycine-generating enzyme family protein n=1 Tax=Candidatus Methylumidiphilus alinenensis TaxID=2202197 RepID=A0A2W4RB77_9GAMM|nr:MAG: formylglycine-generating enzyme family protein [Candidatus Methylumidiphilus alinenensis]
MTTQEWAKTKNKGANMAEITIQIPAGTVFRDRLKDGSEGPTMVVIPAGHFMMGSPEAEKDRISNEGPQHRVNFAKPFAMGRDPVTFDEYDRFALAAGKPLRNDHGWGRGNRPVISMVWQHAKAYADWLSQQTGQRYRLPSEAEWEYAARAGTTTAYWWGDVFDANRAHANRGLSASGFLKSLFSGSKTKHVGTYPVDTYPANPWGLRDTSGNVWEWTADGWHDNYEGAPDDGSAWVTGGDAGLRVWRGGSWSIGPVGVRSAYRFNPDNPGNPGSFGFRLARTL